MHYKICLILVKGPNSCIQRNFFRIVKVMINDILPQNVIRNARTEELKKRKRKRMFWIFI